ncbi:MAG: hypothetical protein QW167_00795 [Thermoplasmata archaeon]
MFAYQAILRVENPLSFRTSEYGNVIRMGRILHNWALMFAINGIRGNPEKSHRENLANCQVYATPAVVENASFEFQTYHPFPEAPYLLAHPEKLKAGSLAAYQSNYTVLHYKEFATIGSTFRFALLSKVSLPPTMIITYGGKQTLQRVFLEEADFYINETFQGTIRHPINPLDFPDSITLTNYFEYSIPPSPLFEGKAANPFRAFIIKKGLNEYLVPPSW